MTYRLEFLPSARKEWNKLGVTIRQQLVKKLRERLEQPRVPASALHRMPDHYKIKLRSVGYRVQDAILTVTVVAAGKRDGSEVYETAAKR